MDSARIAALLEPFLDRPLTPAQLDQTLTYIDLLLRWNARINLTAIRNPAEIVTRHFGESFFLGRHLFPVADSQPPILPPLSTPCHPERSHAMSEANGSAESKDSSAPTASASPRAPLEHVPRNGISHHARVLDLGSGAGFPGLPLKILAPHIRLTLIESNHKKAAFLREVARTLTLTNINVIAERIEAVADRAVPIPAAPTRSSIALAASPSNVDIVTLRAVEKFDHILPLALRLLAPHSRLALLIGSSQIPKIMALSALSWRTIPIPMSKTRLLSIGSFRKVA